MKDASSSGLNIFPCPGSLIDLKMKPLMILALCAAILCIASAKPITRRDLCDPRSSNYQECLIASQELCVDFPETCVNKTLSRLALQHNESPVLEESVETLDDHRPYEAFKPIQLLPPNPMPDYHIPPPLKPPGSSYDTSDYYKHHRNIPNDNQEEDSSDILDSSSGPTQDLYTSYDSHPVTHIPGELRMNFPGQRFELSDIQQIKTMFS